MREKKKKQKTPTASKVYGMYGEISSANLQKRCKFFQVGVFHPRVIDVSFVKLPNCENRKKNKKILELTYRLLSVKTLQQRHRKQRVSQTNDQRQRERERADTNRNRDISECGEYAAYC